MIFQTNDDTTTTPKIWPCRASTLYGRVPGRYFEGSRSVITFGRRSPFVRHIPFQDKSTFGRRRGRHIFWLNELCNDDNNNNDNNNNVVIIYQSIGSLFDPMNDLQFAPIHTTHSASTASKTDVAEFWRLPPHTNTV